MRKIYGRLLRKFCGNRTKLYLPIYRSPLTILQTRPNRVSVGQEPDIRELQDSLLTQINDQTLNAETPEKVLKELKSAAKGLKILLIIDDLWDPKHEVRTNLSN